MKSPWMTGLMAALALPSCLAFHYEGQEVHMRHDAEADRLEIAIVYTGVHGAGAGYSFDAGDAAEVEIDPGPDRSGADESAASLVAEIGAGRRYFLFYDWPLLIDLDSDKIEEPVDDPHKEAVRRAALEFAQGVRVDRSALFLDEDGELGIVQHWVISNLSVGLGIVNDALNEGLVLNRAAFLASPAQGEPAEQMFPDLSLATRERWVERAEAGEPWIVATRGGFELRVPLSSAEFALVLSNIVAETANLETDARGFFVPVSRALSEITHSGGILVARFLPTDSGWLSFDFERSEWEADGKVLALLRERGATLEALSREEARTLARGQ